LSSLRVYSTDLYSAGAVCGQAGRRDDRHHAKLAERLDQIEAAYDLLGHQREGVLKVGITPWLRRSDGTNENHLVCGSGGMKYELQF
jgi:hypothetical protein